MSKNLAKMSKKILAVISAGSEEMEFTITVDILRRAGVNVTVGGLEGSDPVTCSRQVIIVPDKALSDVSTGSFDGIFLPGGLGGAKNMCESKPLGELLKKLESEGKVIAAICAAPTALLAHSIGLGKSITSYPSLKDQLAGSYKYVDDQVVVQDGQLLTSRGPGTTMVFGLKLAEILVGMEKSQEVAKGMLLNGEYKLN
ncbi:hypothetical protein HA402_011802 [Bradysia odoriphaga]|nr:hypothetical protein HA402_011802 [Bradysia odoriphaga]